MKKITVLMFCIMALGFAPRLYAQDKVVPKLVSVKEKDDLVEFTVTSSKRFIYGNNTYVLHIGDRNFTRNRQTHDPVTKAGTLTFLLTENEYNTLEDGRKVYLTYGSMNETEQALDEMSSHDFPACWAMGKFSKDQLTK